MINLGIDTSRDLIYEGDIGGGRGLWPTPVVTPATFVPAPYTDLRADASSFGYRFREDSFDPIARIRRGRFYLAEGSLQITWRVGHHPGAPWDAITPGVNGHQKSLETFYGNPIWHKHIKGQRELPLVLLGTGDRITVWSILSVEAIISGEDLVTLKARSNFGILPKLKTEAIPEAFRIQITEAVDRFVDEVHRSSPVSVIDRARDVATYALLAHLNLRGVDTKDLGDLIKRLDPKNVVVSNATNIIARLHARAKPAEKEKHGLSPIREQDADLVVQCLSSILRELGWAE